MIAAQQTMVVVRVLVFNIPPYLTGRLEYSHLIKATL